MQYHYQRWILGTLSLITIGNTTFLALQLAVRLSKLGLPFLIPLVIVVPALMTYFLLGTKIPPDAGPTGEPQASLYVAVRGDFITFAVLTTAATVYVILER